MFTGSGCEAYADDERLGPVFEAHGDYKTHEMIDLNEWTFVCLTLLTHFDVAAESSL